MRLISIYEIVTIIKKKKLVFLVGFIVMILLSLVAAIYLDYHLKEDYEAKIRFAIKKDDAALRASNGLLNSLTGGLISGGGTDNKYIMALAETNLVLNSVIDEIENQKEINDYITTQLKEFKDQKLNQNKNKHLKSFIIKLLRGSSTGDGLFKTSISEENIISLKVNGPEIEPTIELVNIWYKALNETYDSVTISSTRKVLDEVVNFQDSLKIRLAKIQNTKAKLQDRYSNIINMQDNLLIKNLLLDEQYTLLAYGEASSNRRRTEFLIATKETDFILLDWPLRPLESRKDSFAIRFTKLSLISITFFMITMILQILIKDLDIIKRVYLTN